MTSKAYSTFVFLFITFTALGQYRLSGVVRSQEDSTALRVCVVYLNDGTSATTDNRGNFTFNDVANGSYTVHVTSDDFKYHQLSVTIKDKDQFVAIALEQRTETLEEVVVSDAGTAFGFGRMRAVENVGIYEAKKSEVIIPSQLVANLATNNARQIYSRVAGLNIWENDGAGLQLSIGGRGLDPNRTANFNVRQNGYDISADALGYPESYYTPPVEGIGRIQIVRGAASLQYGTQFGGLINFEMKKPVADRKLELTSRQTVGSFGFYNAFTSASGTVDKISYYTFAQYKRGDGFRPNSRFDNLNLYGHVAYALNQDTKVGVDVTHTSYLSQQPGGLTDEMFAANPRQSNRERNWFKINWNLIGVHFDHKFNSMSELNVRVFGLSASRYSLGFRPNRVGTVDDNSERDLIKGKFENWGVEARFLQRYQIYELPSVLLVGSRYYHGFNHSQQGPGSAGKDANFSFVNPEDYITYDYRFPNRNTSFFVENAFFLHDKFSVTPGVRYEYINTTAAGYYGTLFRDLAGNIISKTRTDENRNSARQFVLFGLGLSYKPTSHLDVYTNVSQNYRSVTFNDMRIQNMSAVIDPNLHDEEGYSIDLGVRSEQTSLVNFDLSLFYLAYNSRIGEYQFADKDNRIKRLRTNIGKAVMRGIEAYGEIDALGYLLKNREKWALEMFGNVALIDSEYRSGRQEEIKGNKVEFVPEVNIKTGLRMGYKDLKASFQYSYLSSQYTDATNAEEGGVSAIVGKIPAYSVMDFSASYQYKLFRVEATINNIANQMYFTRRATGYPGPGILPSDGRGYFLTLQVKL